MPRSPRAAHADARETERFKRVESWRERLITRGRRRHWPSWRAGARTSTRAEWARRVSAAQSERARSGGRRRGLAGVVSRFARIVRYNAVMKPLVGIIMGSASDWETMQCAAELLDKLAVPYEVRVVSAHRTPDLLFEYAAGARARGPRGADRRRRWRGAPAGHDARPRPACRCSACRCSQRRSAASTPCCRSCRCRPACRWRPSRSAAAGATNAALCAAAILANKHPAIATALEAFRERQTAGVLGNPDPRATPRT